MTVARMVYAIVVSGLLATAALALERGAAFVGFPRRVIWAVALLAAVIISFRQSALPAPATPTPGTVIVRNGVATNESAAAAPSRGPVDRLGSLTRALDGYARSASVAASIVLLVFFGRIALLIRQRRRVWAAAKIGGCDVLIAPDVGPAVLGWFQPTIVLPRWALDLDQGDRNLILRHEVEHVRARDPLLVLFSGVLLVLFPWNAVFWWMAHRLRLAIEVDCDARVVRDAGSSHQYGLLLVAVGERFSMPFPTAASLADDQSFLARRINAMTALRPKQPVLAALPFVAVALAASIAAAQTPAPPAAARPAIAMGGMGVGGMSPRTAGLLDTVKALIQANYPKVLTDGAPGYNYRIGFVFDAAGNLARTGLSVTTPDGEASDTLRAGVTRGESLDLSSYGLTVYPREHVGATSSFSSRGGQLGRGNVFVYLLHLK